MTTETLLYLLGAFLAGASITFLLSRGQRSIAVKAATSGARAEISLANDRLERQKKVTEEVIREKIRLATVVEQLTTEVREETAGRAAGESASRRVEELEETLRQRDASLAELREQLGAHEQHKATLETTLEKEREAAAEKHEILEKAHEKLSETFKALSSEALKSNNQQFMEIATTAFEKLHGEAKADLEAREQAVADIVAPVRETLVKVDTKIQKIEDERLDAYGSLTEQIKNMDSAQDHLRDETTKLANALRSPVTRGSWGEMQLRRVVEIAGMRQHCDFVEQECAEPREASLRPDMVVRLPGGKTVVVDAKTPLSAYLDAIETDNEDQAQAKLAEHARRVREKITELTRKAYWSQFHPTPEFVILFLPGEMFFSAALKEDASLIEYGADQRVILATPTTLIALLRAVAYGWQEQCLTENAKAIRNLGQELYSRISTMAEHWGRVGQELGTAVDAYNKALGSLETGVLISARKFKALHVESDGADIVTIEPLGRVPRDLQAPELAQLPKTGRKYTASGAD